MIEKTNSHGMPENYALWPERKLNARIMELYEQIERATLQNLEIARKNSELEVQIATIDEVINSHPLRQTPTQPSPPP